MNQNLPYFKEILGSPEDLEAAICFSDYMHWGYWDRSQPIDTTASGFARAAERLTEEFCRSLDIQDGQRILDVGSGFGGLAQYLGLHYRDISYVGINIDPAQIDYANTHVDKQRLASCEFVEADAVALPFSSNSFDRVLALESIFHFSSRRHFLQEALRVLAVDGVIGCTDFVGTTQLALVRSLLQVLTPGIEMRTWGPLNIISAKDYQQLALELGLERHKFEDITSAVQPSYTVMRKVPCLNRTADFRLINRLLDIVSHLGWIRYHIYSWSA